MFRGPWETQLRWRVTGDEEGITEEETGEQKFTRW